MSKICNIENGMGDIILITVAYKSSIRKDAKLDTLLRIYLR